MDAKRSNGKPGKKPSRNATPTGEGLFGWFGRQVGHVKKAVQTDVTAGQSRSQSGSSTRASAKPKSSKSAARPSAKAQPTAAPRSQAKGPKPAAATRTPPPQDTVHNEHEKVVFRQDQVEEAELPDRPGVVLRRTIIDEVVIESETTTRPPAPRRPPT